MKKFAVVLFVFALIVLFWFSCAPGRKAVTAKPISKADLETAELKGGGGAPFGNPPQKDNADNPIRPAFSCCEANIVIKETVKKGSGVVIDTVTPPGAAGKVTKITARIRLPIEFDCNQLQKQDCSATFQSVSVARDIRIANTTLGAGGAAQGPEQKRVWWNQAVAPCDGKKCKTTLDVVYVARYRIEGNLANETGENLPPNTQALTLTFTMAEDKGETSTLRFLVKGDTIWLPKG